MTGLGWHTVGRWPQIRNYVLVRLCLAPVMVWTVVTVVFVLLRATPGDPVDAVYGGRAPAAVKEALRVQLGLDRPLWVQYLHYLGQLVRGNLGMSLTEPGRAVKDIIAAYLPATVELGLAGFLVAAGLVALWWLAQVTAERQLVHQIHAEEEARYKAALERDPNNAAAWSALGDLYLEAKRYDDAIACYERAVQIMPTATKEKRKLRRAQQLKEEAQRTQRHCPQCHSPLPLLAVTCPQCGEEVSAPVWVYLLAAARDREALRRTFLAFLVAFPIVTLWLMLFFALNFLGRALLLLFTLVAILIVVMMELRG